MSVESRVAAGVAWLDETKPVWEKLVDVDKLDMKNGNSCICGQVFHEEGRDKRVDGYGYACDILSFSQLYSYAFNSDRSVEDEWKRVIKERLAVPSSREDVRREIEVKREELRLLEKKYEKLPKIRYFAMHHSTKPNYSFTHRVVRGRSDGSEYQDQQVTFDTVEAARESVNFTQDMDSWTYTILSIDENSRIEVVERKEG